MWTHVDGSPCDIGEPASLLDQGQWCVPHQQWFNVSGAPAQDVVPLPNGPERRD